MNEGKDDDFFFGADDTLWTSEEQPKSDTDTSDEMIPNETPLYQNQMDDPAVRAEYDNYLQSFNPIRLLELSQSPLSSCGVYMVFTYLSTLTTSNPLYLMYF